MAAGGSAAANAAGQAQIQGPARCCHSVSAKASRATLQAGSKPQWRPAVAAATVQRQASQRLLSEAVMGDQCALPRFGISQFLLPAGSSQGVARLVGYSCHRMHALYPGSFDPVTFGHLEIVRRGLAVFGELTVAVASNLGKTAVFDLEERLALLRESLPDAAGLHVVAFDGLVVDYCREHGHGVIVRGLRNASDLDYEYQMANTNAQLADEIETVFLMAGSEHAHLSSSLIKEIARFGGDLAAFVPPTVATKLVARLRQL